MELSPKKTSLYLLFLLGITTIIFCCNVISGEEIETVEIGVIFPSDKWMGFLEPVVLLAKEDINEYMAENDYPYRFEFVYKNANESPETHVEKLVELKEQGIDLVIGGLWTNQAGESLEYIDENDMIMISFCLLLLILSFFI